VPTILARCSEGCIGFIEALFCPRRSTLTWQEPRSLHSNGGESPARPPPLNTKAGFINCMSYSLPKYYFQDIHPEIMDEIMRTMQAALREPSSEEIDNWPNTHNIASNIPGWCDHAGEFTSTAS